MGQPNHYVTSAKNFVKTVAREVRDVPTAVGTFVRSSGKIQAQPDSVIPTEISQERVRQAAGNLIKQVKEVGSAVIKNKSGTSSDTVSFSYKTGEKRK